MENVDRDASLDLSPGDGMTDDGESLNHSWW